MQHLSGMDVKTYTLRGSPFMRNGSGKKIYSTSIASDTIQRDIVQSTSDYA